MRVRLTFTNPTNSMDPPVVLASVFRLEESYVCRFSIDAPVSTMPTFDNDVITYLNKGRST